MTGEIKSHYEVVVVGAGVSGIYQIKRLADLGVDALVLDAAPDLGGTWYWNRYPGARFDSESYTYGYSFSKELLNEWHWQERFRASRRIFATSTMSPTSSICANTCGSTAGWKRRRSTRAVIYGGSGSTTGVN
ncbi:NAD(P)-binding protein [Bradyrhizobium sp. sBnM-33]|uniref:NAD(P)-binding protein n=1 Tax=Bradyrhizobium sp. sBnM-33 TaxID=2831780 RepID=UPI0020C0ED81|nr:NAD(P)-binding protein [Bradyrhizobium sp. sBnM-33]WOH52063.1 NAD(P)-binding protein [Bradyrhizobium sp. sBnM-33]